MTVSTGVLNEDVIRFVPQLPPTTLDAIAGLPLGNYNRIRLSIPATLFDPEIPERIVSIPVDDQPMSLSIRPYGRDCVIGLVGGRYADYLEKTGPSASRAVVLDHLRHVFGGDLLRHVKGDRQSAWRGDPLIRGAYSAAAPGQSFQRAVLSQTLHERLLFAGEATSPDQFSTCHGAVLTGRRAAAEIISLSQH
jgi:monoamine oxidase